MLAPVFVVAAMLSAGVLGEPEKPIAMGNVAVHYNVKSGISTDAHPLQAKSLPIWCQATLNTELINIASAKFVKQFTHKEFEGQLDPTSLKYNMTKGEKGGYKLHFTSIFNTTDKKASLDLDEDVRMGAGKYRCEMTLEDDTTIFGNLFAYARPFFHSNGSLHLQMDEQDPFYITANKVYVPEGEVLRLSCPAAGYPTPSIIWYKDAESLKDQFSKRIYTKLEGKMLVIENVTEEDKGVYRCTAHNNFPTYMDEKQQDFEASLEQAVELSTEPPPKYPYAWVYPLLVIIVILLLLFIIIYACAACKRYQHDQYNVAKRERLLRHTPSPKSSKYDYVENR